MTYIPLFNGFLRVSIFAPAAAWLLAASEGILPFLCIFAAAAIHELGHLAAIRAAKCRVTRVTVFPFGGLIECTSASDDRNAFFIAAGGIAANAACAFVFACVFCFWKNAYLLLFLFASLFFALTNLVPLRSSDGGKMAYIAAERRYGAAKAEKICAFLAFCGAAFLLALAFYILWISGFNNGLCVLLLIAALPK